MAALTIALLGAPHADLQMLADALNSALKASGWQVFLVVPGNAQADTTNLCAFDLVLLCGLQPSAQSQIEAQDPALEAQDLLIRARLALAAVSYRVLYGTAEERLAHALNAIESLLPRAETSSRPKPLSGSVKKQPWVWMCEKCSDPQCEHQLLTALLGQRTDQV
ncbi:hypothetical protein RCH06_002148 [Polaromonas sp. CG_9.5]|uniref:hypothetical protein n=1 Tax=Polaromonas sp. CG_9.5 TaxID=3071705 RepID=UPI002E08AB4C|nr:hypothetical protein [Polaromonas sp. CG_9.5]